VTAHGKWSQVSVPHKGWTCVGNRRPRGAVRNMGNVRNARDPLRAHHGASGLCQRTTRWLRLRWKDRGRVHRATLERKGPTLRSSSEETVASRRWRVSSRGNSYKLVAARTTAFRQLDLPPTGRLRRAPG